MLRTIKMEQLPSYEIGYKRGAWTGRQEGIEIGRLSAKLESAQVMLEMGIPAEEIAKRLGVPLSALVKL